MKKTLWTIISIVSITFAYGQSSPSYSNLFDSLFVNISMTDATTGILYDRVIPFAQLQKHNSIHNPNVDTIDADMFLQGYFELYNSAFLSNSKPPYSVKTLRNHILKDTNLVEIGLIYYRFNAIDSNIATIKLYYDSDSMLHEDNTVSQSLYKEDTVFIASPMVRGVAGTHVRFRIQNDFVFNNTGDKINSCNVDFGDGTGFRNVSINETISVNYSDTGIHTLRVRITLTNNQVYESFSYLYCFIKSNTEIAYPKDTFAIRAKTPIIGYEGDTSICATGKICIFYANSDKHLRKPILISDGFDPQNTRSFESGEAGKESLWSMLSYNNKHLGDTLIRVYDYDIVFIDYDDGGEYIERNAMVFVAALDTLNKMLQQNQSQEQIVVVGPSMGGPVTHYALSYIENNPSILTNNGKHNCRLWIAFDAPQQGANISLGAQAFMYFFGSVGNNEQALYVWEDVLNCPAAKQMLKYQFNIYAPVQPFQTCSLTINQHFPHPFFTHFYESISELGYPTNSRNISIINGSLNSITNGNGCSTAIELDASFNIRVSKIKLFPTSGVCEMFYGMFATTIDYILGKRNKLWLFSPAVNNYSIDAAPGGTFYTFQMIHDAAHTNNQVKQDTMMRSSHCFMPITSTLDISGEMNYCTDISSRDLVAEGLTPFDSYTGVMDSNMYHATLNQNIVDYLINEIETYIQGPREVQLCTRPTYTLHLPQDSVATVTWLCSDSVRLITGSNPYEVTVVPLATGDGWISAEVSTLKHRKRLANYPIHITQNILPEIDTVSYVTDTLHMNTTMLLGGSLCVDSNKIMLVSGTLHCTPSSRIIVRPGGKLIVDGGTLTSACAGEMWQGVYVEGHRDQPQYAANQGTVQLLNGAVIENAFRGVYTGAPGENWHTTGGIVTADSAMFRNCAKAVEFLSYCQTLAPGDVADNKGSFSNCTFTVDDNNLFAANDTDFLAHVTLWDVKGVKFSHCRFEDVRSGTHTRKSAISTIDAGFAVKNGCNYKWPPIILNCDCHLTTGTYCSFDGFGTAVDAGSSGCPYAVCIDGAHFSNNVTGVDISGNSHAEVTRCTFHLDSIIPDYRSVTGLSLSGCTGYLVEENTFTRDATAPSGNRYGILVGASGTDMNCLYRNTFERLTRGITVSGINGDGNSNTGLEMACNGFSNNTYDMYIASGATVRTWQGNSGKGADNSFSGTQASSLYNAGSQLLTYIYSAGTGHVPYNPTSGNVTLNGTAASNNCASTICGVNQINPPWNLKSPTPEFLALKQQYANMADSAESLDFASLQRINAVADEMFAQSHAAIRTLMADSLEDIPAVWEWLNATPGMTSRYLAVETGFVAEPAMGTNTMAGTRLIASLQDIADHLTAAAERDEHGYYVAFHALKQALADNGHVAWPHATDAQVWELVRIADANTGRSSLLAKNVLCFFFGICYDDELETRALAAATIIPPQAEPTTLTGKHKITVHPNPAHDALRVAVTEGEIARIEMFDAFGRHVAVETHGRAPLPSPTTTVNTSDIPSGVYVLRVTLTDGSVRNVKVVKD